MLRATNLHGWRPTKEVMTPTAPTATSVSVLPIPTATVVSPDKAEQTVDTAPSAPTQTEPTKETTMPAPTTTVETATGTTSKVGTQQQYVTALPTSSDVERDISITAVPHEPPLVIPQQEKKPWYANKLLWLGAGGLIAGVLVFKKRS